MQKDFEFLVLDLRDDRIYNKFIALIGTVHVILVTEEKEKKEKKKESQLKCNTIVTLLFLWLVQ